MGIDHRAERCSLLNRLLSYTYAFCGGLAARAALASIFVAFARSWSAFSRVMISFGIALSLESTLTHPRTDDFQSIAGPKEGSDSQDGGAPNADSHIIAAIRHLQAPLSRAHCGPSGVGVIFWPDLGQRGLGEKYAIGPWEPVASF